MGWLATWSYKRQKRELEDFMIVLRQMDGDEIGHLVAMVYDQRRIHLEHFDRDFLFPFKVCSQRLDIAVFLNGVVQRLQKEGKPQVAAATMVWLHTIRGALNPRLRGEVRQMWRELERGFPYAETAAALQTAAIGRPVIPTGLGTFPEGFTPTPR